MLHRINSLFKELLFDEVGDTLATTYSFSANTLIVASQFNTNFADIEAVVNALTADNLSADCVGKAALASDVVRAGYGLIQHTDGALYVDPSDTNPCLEISDGGLRAKVYGMINRTANGLTFGRTGDIILSSCEDTPDGWDDVSATYADKFIRISATALTAGGDDEHTHAAGSYAGPSHTHTVTPTRQVSSGPNTNFNVCQTAGETSSASGTGSVTGTSGVASDVPAYITTKMYQKS